VVRHEPGKTKISIRLHNTVLEYFRDLVDKMGGGNYQTLINDALLEYVHRRSTLDVVRQVVRRNSVLIVLVVLKAASGRGRKKRAAADAGLSSTDPSEQFDFRFFFAYSPPRAWDISPRQARVEQSRRMTWTKKRCF